VREGDPAFWEEVEAVFTEAIGLHPHFLATCRVLQEQVAALP